MSATRVSAVLFARDQKKVAAFYVTVFGADTTSGDASRLGGSIDAQPPPWAAGDANYFLGQDPEGNVFGLKVRR